MDFGPLPRGWVRKAQQRVMQTVAQVTRQSPAVLLGNPSGRVEPIANQGMSGRGQVNADLVGPARGDAHVSQEGVLPAFEHGHEG